MTLYGWTSLWIVAGALAASACGDHGAESHARQKRIQELEALIASNEELRAATERQIQLLEETIKVLDRRFPESPKTPAAAP